MRLGRPSKGFIWYIKEVQRDSRSHLTKFKFIFSEKKDFWKKMLSWFAFEMDSFRRRNFFWALLCSCELLEFHGPCCQGGCNRSKKFMRGPEKCAFKICQLLKKAEFEANLADKILRSWKHGCWYDQGK
jgi:hypothetical protein